MFKGVLVFCFKCEFVCVSVLLFRIQRSIYRSVLYSVLVLFVCPRASVPLSLFCLSVQVSYSKICISICILIQVLVLFFCFKSEFACVCFFLFCFQRPVYRSVLYSKICISIYVLFIRILYSFQVRVQVLFFCSNLFRSWFSVSFFLFCSVFVFFVFCIRFQVRVQVLYH